MHFNIKIVLSSTLLMCVLGYVGRREAFLTVKEQIKDLF